MDFIQIKDGGKIGIHNNQYGNGAQFVKDGLAAGIIFPFFKSVNNGGVVVEVKKLSPQTKTIWRIYRDPDLDGRDLDVYSDIERIADARVKEIVDNSSLEERQHTDYFECHNENHPKSYIGTVRWAELQKLFVLKLAAYGLKAAVGGLNCGTLEYWQMIVVFDTGLFEVCNQYGAIFTIHEGALPMEGSPPHADALWGMFGTIPESPFVRGGGILTFRYRFWLYLAREVYHIPFPPIVVSEFYPIVDKPLQDVPIELIADIYRRLELEIWADPELVAVLPFCVGGPGWEHEQHGFAYPALIELMKTLKNRQNAIRGEIPAPAPQPLFGTVKPNLKNLRNGPETTSRILANLAGGQVVELVNKQGEWYKVRYEVDGWMHESTLTV